MIKSRIFTDMFLLVIHQTNIIVVSPPLLIVN